MEYLKDWIWWAWTSFMAFAHELGWTLVEKVLYWLPTEWQSMTFGSTMGQYYQVLNAWLPVNEAIGLYASMMAFKCFVVCLRWMIKFIPFLGG